MENEITKRMQISNNRFLITCDGKYTITKELAPELIFAVLPVCYEKEDGIDTAHLELLEYVNTKSLSTDLQQKIRIELKLPILKPKFPLNKIIKEGFSKFCPICGSSYARKYWIFGKRYCININCSLHANRA